MTVALLPPGVSHLPPPFFFFREQNKNCICSVSAGIRPERSPKLATLMQRVGCGIPNLLEPDPFCTCSSYHFQPGCSVFMGYGKICSENFSTNTPNMVIICCGIIADLYHSHAVLAYCAIWLDNSEIADSGYR